MKKLLAIASSFCLIFSIQAQITITSSDLPQADSTYTLQESTPNPLFDYAATGEDYTWDYSDLETNGEVIVEYGDVGNAPASAQFMFNNAFLYPDYLCLSYGPGEMPDFSQMGVDLPLEVGEMLNYYQTDDSYNIAGISVNMQGMDIPVQYEDIDEIFSLPLNYSDELSSTSAYALEVPGVLTYSSAGDRTTVVDGWGTIQLPNDEEYEVLRVTSTRDMSDSFELTGQTAIPFTYSTTTHQWLASSTGTPVLEVSSMFGAAYRVRYLGTTPEVEDTSDTEGITGLSPEPLKLFPNPVNSGDVVNLGLNGNSNWEVIDTNGKIQLTGVGNKVRTDALESGIFFVICRESGNEPAVLVVQ